MIEAFEPVQDRQVFQQCKAHQRWFLQYATLTGRLRLPGWEADPARYYRAYWQPSGHRLLDPLRETKAHTEQMGTLTRSPQEICAERGRDLEDVFEEIRQAKALAEEKGLDLVAALGGASTTVKNNPAALGAAEEEDGEGADADGGGKSAGAAHGRKIHAIKTKK
jgi:capsid protein